MKFNKKKKMKEFQDPYSFANAVTEGDSMTKLSMVIMGAGHFKHKQFIPQPMKTLITYFMNITVTLKF